MARCSHCLLSHLALIHVSWGLVLVREWSQISDQAQHIGWIQFLVCRDSLANIFVKASNIHKSLLQGTNELCFASSSLKDGTDKSRGRCEKE
mmetsp:Transcript_33821/g.98343  ORF Transcript_33821/g.98343 Transcript_33821/m.98343 type:complete len:92 (+) Transcript_33821:76-351(+)